MSDAGGGGRRRLRLLAAAALLLLGSATARADAGDRAVGFRTEGLWLHTQDTELNTGAWRVTALVEEGLSDWLAARLEAGIQLAGEVVAPGAAGAEPSLFSGLGTLGVVAAFDVLTWVPEVYLGGGLLVGDTWRARLVSRLGVKRYISLHTALLIQLVGEWVPDQAFYTGAAFGMTWSVN